MGCASLNLEQYYKIKKGEIFYYDDNPKNNHVRGVFGFSLKGKELRLHFKDLYGKDNSENPCKKDFIVVYHKTI